MTTRCECQYLAASATLEEREESGYLGRFQYEKSPSGDKKSCVLFTLKHPHCSLTLIYVSICLLFFSCEIFGAGWLLHLGSQVKAHVGALTKCEHQRPQDCSSLSHHRDTALSADLNTIPVLIIWCNFSNNDLVFKITA